MFSGFTKGLMAMPPGIDGGTHLLRRSWYALRYLALKSMAGKIINKVLLDYLYCLNSSSVSLYAVDLCGLAETLVTVFTSDTSSLTPFYF